MNRCSNGMYLKWWAGIDIRDILLSSDALVEVIGDKVYPIVAPLETLGSFIVYRRVKYLREYSKMGLVEDKARVEITAVDEDYEHSVALAALIDAVLTGTHTSTEGASLTFQLIDSEEGFNDMKYTQILTFEIK